MSYKQRVVETHGHSLGGAQAIDSDNMIRDLEEHKTIKGVAEDDESKTVLVPFHAVEVVIKLTSMVDKDDRNPYYCEPSGGGDAVCSSKVCTAKVAC